MASIEFNGQQLVKQLDLATRVQLPFLAAVTVNRLASQVRKDLQAEMLDSFTYVNAFTYRSPKQFHFATKADPWTEVYIQDEAAKGNAPSRYLLPQIQGGMVYRTRFQQRLASELGGYNGRYMIPILDSPGTKRNALGRMQAGQYTEALYGIKAMESLRASMRPGKYRTEGSYVYVPYVGANQPLAKQMRALGKGKIPKPGIYRMMSDDAVQVFRQLERVPTVQRRFDFAYASQLSVDRNAGKIFDQAVAEFVRKF
jgi:hypothetical protein